MCFHLAQDPMVLASKPHPLHIRRAANALQDFPNVFGVFASTIVMRAIKGTAIGTRASALVYNSRGTGCVDIAFGHSGLGNGCRQESVPCALLLGRGTAFVGGRGRVWVSLVRYPGRERRWRAGVRGICIGTQQATQGATKLQQLCFSAHHFCDAAGRGRTVTARDAGSKSLITVVHGKLFGLSFSLGEII